MYLLDSCAISLFVDVLFEIDSYIHFDFHILPANIPITILYIEGGLVARVVKVF